MAIEEQTNNLNSFSYEGAGKVYETLATNAAGEARAAGEAKTTALAEHRQASSQAANFRNAASATQSKANNVLNAATASVDAANRNAANVDIQTSLQISTALANVGEQYLSAKVDAETLQGTIEGMKRKGDLEGQLLSDPNMVINEIETTLEQLSRDPNNPYLQAYIKQISTQYMPARGEKEANRVNGALSGYQAYLEKHEGNISNEDRNGYANSKGLNASMLKDVEYKYNVQRAIKDVQDAPMSIDALNAVNKEWGDFRSEKYDNVHWVKSKSAATKHVITTADAEYTQALKTKAGQIKTVATDYYNYALKNPVASNMDAVAQSIKGMQKDRQGTINAIDKFELARKEGYEWDIYTLENMDSRDKEIGTVPEKKKDEYEATIANDLLHYLDTGDLTSIESIMNNRSNNLSGFKGEFFRLYNAGSDEEKAKMGNAVALMTSEKVGKTRMGQLLGTKELSELQVINGIAKGYKGDYNEAADIYNDGASWGKGGADPALETYGDIIETHASNLYKSGSNQVEEFRQVAVRVARARPLEAQAIIDRVFENYNVMVGKEDTTGYLITMGGITVDKTYASPSYEQDVSDDGKTTIRETMLAIAENKGVTGSRITFQVGGMVRVEDRVTGTSVQFNYEPLVKAYHRNEYVTEALGGDYTKGLPTRSTHGRRTSSKKTGADLDKYNQDFAHKKLNEKDATGEYTYTQLEVMKFMKERLGPIRDTVPGTEGGILQLDTEEEAFLDTLGGN